MNDDDYFGPSLPPGYGAQLSSETNSDVQTNPDHRKHRKRRHHSSGSSHKSSSSVDENSSKSSISNSSQPKRECDVVQPVGSGAASARPIGPALPPGYKLNAVEQNGSDFIGPVLPSSFTIAPVMDVDDDEDGTVGPMPILDSEARAQAAFNEIESRAQSMKNKLLGKEDPNHPSTLVVTREEWMTELPPELTKNFGVTARKFSTKVTSSTNKDRSAWTDTPADRARKEKEILEGKVPEVKAAVETGPSAIDLLYREQVDEYNKLARPKSLLEMHSEKLAPKSHKSHKSHHSKKKKKKDKESKEEKKRKKDKKKKKKKKSKSKDSDSSDSSDDNSSKSKDKKADVPQRRPFDREKDLQISRMDDAHRKLVINRSQELTGRFGHSSSGQFL